MKKRFNWLGLLSIIAYIIVLMLLCIATFSRSSPMDSVWWLLFCAWIIPGFLLPLMAWDRIVRYALPEIKEDAVVVYRAIETERRYSTSLGHFHNVSVPVLTFELLQSKKQLQFGDFTKTFRFFRVGDAGVIVYKKKKNKYYYVNFIRK